MPYKNIGTQVFEFENFQIIPLSKCGSTSLTARESGNNWLSVRGVEENYDALLNDTKKTYVCVRSPQSRFPSALKEAIYRRNYGDTEMEQEMFDILVDIEHDENSKEHIFRLLDFIESTKQDYSKFKMESHLAPLWTHFHEMPVDIFNQLIFFDLSQLDKMYESHLGIPLVRKDGGVSTSGHGGYEKWTSIIESDQKLIELIDKVYEDDYKLYGRVEKL